MAIYEGVQRKTHKEFELTVFCRKEWRNLAAIIGAGKKHKENLEKGEDKWHKKLQAYMFQLFWFFKVGHKSKKLSETMLTNYTLYEFNGYVYVKNMAISS